MRSRDGRPGRQGVRGVPVELTRETPGGKPRERVDQEAWPKPVGAEKPSQRARRAMAGAGRSTSKGNTTMTQGGRLTPSRSISQSREIKDLFRTKIKEKVAREKAALRQRVERRGAVMAGLGREAAREPDGQPQTPRE